MNRILAVLLLAASVAHAQCPGDVDGDGTVTVDEIVRAVDSGLRGCEAPTELESLASIAGLTLRLSVGDSRTVARYRLAAEPTETEGVPNLAGSNIGTGSRVALGTYGGPEYRFTMFEPTSTDCFAYAFDVVGGRVFGELAIYNRACTAPTQSFLYSVVGTAD